MHIAAIMDGNRRWAKSNAMTRYLGHRHGIEKLEKVIKWCGNHNVDAFTIYALSTENLKRSPEELSDLYDLILEFAKKKEDFKENNVKVKIMGNIDLIRQDSADALRELENYTKDCDGLNFQMCVAYGGRDEIVRACKKVLANNEEITEENLDKYLDSNNQPDIIIRTGGKHRLSNFLAWQSTYAELLFMDKNWPDFNEDDLKNAIDHFKSQQRNFGK